MLEAFRPIYESPHGHPLVYGGVPGDSPVLTCELYSKWYALYLVEPDKTVRPAPLDLRELEQYAEGASVVGDHCWNPYVLQRLADAKDWLIDDLSFDLMVGRWHANRGEPEAIVDEFRESPQRIQYRLLKDGQFFEQERKALEMGIEVHQAIETFRKYGLDFVPVEGLKRGVVISNLSFEPFVFEEEPNKSEYQRSYKRSTEETRKQVRAGAVLKLKDGEIYFVGDCNEMLGGCDDCCDFRHEDIAEIAYLWEEEPESEVQDTWEDKLRAELVAREDSTT